MLASNYFPSSRPKRRESGSWGVRVIIILILLAPLIAFPQGKRANNWYFGWYAGITFNQVSPPVALTDSEMLAAFLTGSATISNTLGEMQFYTDGMHIWNKIHQPMLNAGDIGTNCEQGAIIVPQPDHPNIYYLFNAERIESGTTRYILQYSMIDMNLDNGNGAIVPGHRCVILYDTIVGMFTAVLHQNQKDIWVMSHKQGTNKYYAYLVTTGGLIDTPVESTAGSIFYQAFGGLMKFSPDGTKITTTQNSFEILDFNNLTGVVSDNNVIHGPDGSTYYGVEFSPDNSLFYVSDQNTGIFQYDLKAGNESQVLATKFQVTTPTTSASLQIGPDGKIYISPNMMSYLSVINKPNVVGAGCEFQLEAVDLLGKTNNGRLPTFIQSYMADPKYTTTARCFGQPTKFNIVNTNDIDSVLWEFNDPGNAPNDTSIEFNPTYTFSGPGTYYPKLTVWAGDFIKFAIDTVIIYSGPDIICIPTPATDFNENGIITVITTDTNLTFQLVGYEPQLSNVFNNLKADTYYVIVTDEYGCFTIDTVKIENNQVTLLQALADTARECLHQPANSDIKLARANGLRDMKAVLYYNSLMLNCTNFNANEADFPGITAMIYSSPSRVELSWNGIIALSSADTLLMGSLIFESYDNGISNIEWEDNRAATWFLDSAGDSIEAVLVPGEIEIHELPAASINAPLSVCEGGSAILTALVSGGTDPFELQWTTPSGSSFTDEIHLDTAKLTDSGKYTLTVSDRFHCTGNSEVIFNVMPLPTAGFPGIGDTIPFEQTYFLEATQGYSSYEWSTGDTTYYINVTEEGDYTVTMSTNEGCQAAEHVFMLETWLPISIPNAFTPNDDGLNDVFRPVIDYELVKRFNLTIYNKWGQRIFETVDASAGWDGKDAMTGVYVWMITYENRVRKMFEMKGNVTLVK